MKLYRGDSIPSSAKMRPSQDRGRTFVEHFCGNGLMAKFADGGDSKLLQGKSLLEAVLCHVGYDRGYPEQEFAYRSPFISFSANPAVALDFAERTKRRALEDCLFEDASHFMWELKIDLHQGAEVGRYKFTYKPSSTNCAHLLKEQLHRGIKREDATGDMHLIAQTIMNSAASARADLDGRQHSAELIDVVSYVKGQCGDPHDRRLMENTLSRANRAREWLLYPTTPMADGPGVSSRFAMNSYLRVYGTYRKNQTPDRFI